MPASTTVPVATTQPGSSIRVPRESYLHRREKIITAPAATMFTDVAEPEYKTTQAETQLRLVTALEALYDGKLPTNEQILLGIRSFQTSREIDKRRSTLSSDGAKLLRDINSLLDVVGDIIQSKNKGEEIQEFVYHARLASQSARLLSAERRAAMEEEGGASGAEAGECELINFSFHISIVTLRQFLTNILPSL